MFRDRLQGLLLVGILTAACTGEWVRDYDGYLPGTRGDDYHLAVVIDDRSGEPLAGATVRLYREQELPKPLAPFIAEFETDAYGVLALPWDDKYYNCHWVYEHPGFAAVNDYPARFKEVALEPGRSVTGRLLDNIGTPVVGVAVEYYLGCPHSPAVRRATTGSDGTFTLRDVDPQEGYIWAPAPGGAAEPHQVVLADVPGAVWRTMHAGKGRTVSGQVRDARGRPARDVLVYSNQFPRGPATRTDVEGRFRLLGVTEGAEILAVGGQVIARPAPEWTGHEQNEPEVTQVRLRPPGNLDDYDFENAEEKDGWFVSEVEFGGLRVVRFSHEEYGDGELVVDTSRESVTVGPDAFPVPGRLISPPDSTTHVYDSNGWTPVGPKAYALKPGAWVKLAGESGWKTVVRRLTGPGPWKVEWGSAALRFEVTPGNWSVMVDGEWMRNGPQLLRGLDPGVHTIILSAQGHRSKVARVILRSDETRLIRIVLEPE